MISLEKISKVSFLTLACMLWAQRFFNYVFVAADKVLGTSPFMATTGSVALLVILALASIRYLSARIRPTDITFIVIVLSLYFYAPAARYVSDGDYERFTNLFLMSLPLYLIGVSMDISQLKTLFRILSVASIFTMAYYNLVFIHNTGYAGGAEFTKDNMSTSYGLLLMTIYMTWYTFSHFDWKSVFSWIDLVSVLLGGLAMSMLGTRGPLVAFVAFVVLYVIIFKIPQKKLLYGSVFLIILIVFMVWMDDILMFLASKAVDLGFSDRIFTLLISGEFHQDGNFGRNWLFQTLIEALGESPIYGYGIFGSFIFIKFYVHNIFLEILFSFGYLFGGLIIAFGIFTTIKAFLNDLSDDERGFLLVLIGGGVFGLMFSSAFYLNAAFFMFVGYCVQLAYRK